jgi:hypothetical protein
MSGIVRRYHAGLHDMRALIAECQERFGDCRARQKPMGYDRTGFTMNQMPSADLLKAFDRALEASSRWRRLFVSFGFRHHPSAAALNDALQARGFGRVVDERASSVSLNGPAYRDAWWQAIAREVAGRDDATVDEVVSKPATP